ncbi:GNAT family N-acetyltransferase [Reichenbachiella sp. MALMAid0571]|uniref:GNAT family N-acetyltransferase n=1 Tax=Reichenbachiella sp. MALMAid0571 TaxID=3143939 RepID=UPI0032DF4DBA
MTNELGIAVRQMQVADISGAMQLKKAENWNQTKEDWQMLMDHNPELCLVATCGDQIVGTITATNYANQVAWIGMMLVSRDFRGMGISKLLLNTIIEKLQDCKSIKLDATPEGLPVYRKLGFVEEYQISRMIISNLPVLHNSNNSVSSISNKDLLEISAFDTKVFGVDRSNLIKKLLKRDQGYLVKRKNHVDGFALGRHGCTFAQVGPVVAQCAQDAIEVIFQMLVNLSDEALVMDVLDDKKELKEWLSSLGFKMQRSFVRMYLKTNLFPGEVNRYFLIGGPEIG